MISLVVNNSFIYVCYGFWNLPMAKAVPMPIAMARAMAKAGHGQGCAHAQAHGLCPWPMYVVPSTEVPSTYYLVPSMHPYASV